MAHDQHMRSPDDSDERFDSAPASASGSDGSISDGGSASGSSVDVRRRGGGRGGSGEDDEILMDNDMDELEDGEALPSPGPDPPTSASTSTSTQIPSFPSFTTSQAGPSSSSSGVRHITQAPGLGAQYRESRVGPSGPGNGGGSEGASIRSKTGKASRSNGFGPPGGGGGGKKGDQSRGGDGGGGDIVPFGGKGDKDKIGLLDEGLLGRWEREIGDIFYPAPAYTSHPIVNTASATANATAGTSSTLAAQLEPGLNTPASAATPISASGQPT